jgi:site-specific DNA recombinase
MAVRIIPAQQVARRTGAQEQKILRVAAYARVSTDEEAQETSYEAQVQHYTDYINNHEGWKLAGVFADEGISGTSTAKREQFNKMIEACEAGLVDMVITKSISRWARNTLDSLNYIRKLKALGTTTIWLEGL